MHLREAKALVKGDIIVNKMGTEHKFIELEDDNSLLVKCEGPDDIIYVYMDYKLVEKKESTND